MERFILDPSVPARVNQLVNPSFETNATSWGLATPSWASGSITRVAQEIVNPFKGSSGDYVLRVEAVKDATATSRTGTVSSKTPIGSVSPGSIWSSAFVMRAWDAPILGWTHRIDWYTAASAFISSSTTLPIAAAGSGPPARRILEGLKAPAGASFAEFVLLMSSATSGDIVKFDIDACLLEESPTARVYFDGNTIPTVPTYGVAWSGAPHASTSIITPTRTEFDLTDWIHQDGINWGDAEVNAYRAKGAIGEDVLSVDYPNRPITVPLVIKDVGGTAFATVRSYAQAKAALWQREGGCIARVLDSGKIVYADIVSDGLTLSGGWMQAHRDADPDAELRLEAIPAFYEPEELIAEAEETSAAELIKLIPDPGGDMPARVRIEVIEKQGVDQKGLIWAFRSWAYSPASTARTAYEAEELQTLDAARKVALSGASGGTVVQHGTISTSWTPIVGGRLGGTAFPTHMGTNRLRARVYSTSGTLVRARAIWDVGDLTYPTENEAVRLPGSSNFYMLDLGEVRLNPAPVGAHRWDWQIQAAGDIGNEDFKVDKVWIHNGDEGSAVLTAPVSALEPGFVAYSARDEFNQSAGAATGKVAVTGGTYVALSGSDTTDFTINSALRVLQRTAVSDTGLIPGAGPLTGLSGRAIGLDLNLAATAVRMDFECSKEEALGIKQGFMLRLINASNFLLIFYSEGVIFTYKLNSEEFTRIAEVSVLDGVGSALAGVSLGVRVVGDTFSIYVGRPGGVIRHVATRRDTILSSTLASGDVYIYDENPSAITANRMYNNLAVWVPPLDAVCFASQKVQLSTEGLHRLDSGGTAYGPVSRVVGDLPRLPAGGLENRPTELFVKVSPSDMQELPDSLIPDVAVKVYAQRSWLTVPGTI
jgi:hypothetical protein